MQSVIDSDYAEFLRKRRVDFVMLWDGYDSRFRTNEHILLEELVRAPVPGVDVDRVEQTAEFDLFRVRSVS